MRLFFSFFFCDMHMRKFTDLFFHILEIKYISSNAGIMIRSIGFDSYSIELGYLLKKKLRRW